MRHQDFDIHEVINRLSGTCESISSIIERDYPGMAEDDLDSNDHDSIDGEIFCCGDCGWWCDNDEMMLNEETGEEKCNDCYGN